MHPWRRPIGRRLAVAALVALLLPPAIRVAAQPSRESVCDLTTAERIVAVGDVHGAYDQFVTVLRAAGLIDGRQRWIGGRTTLVQTGDMVDRGPDSRRALDLLRRLERDAARAGGRVHSLIGNHEVMRMSGYLQDVSEQEYRAFRSGQSEELRELVAGRLAAEAAARARAATQEFDEAAYRARYIEETPLGSVEMQIAFGPQGEYGRWLRGHDTVVKINGILFLHGGASPEVASMGCEAVNRAVRAELDSTIAATDPDALSNRETGPLWYRELALQDEAAFAAQVDAVLSAFGARAMVIGHTAAADGRITPRFGGRVFQIDTGMLGHPFWDNGRPSALEIRGGRFTAIYPDRREVIVEGNSAVGLPTAR